MNHQLDDLLAEGVAGGAVPGVVVQVADRDGVVYEGAAGERSIGSGVAMTTDTVGAIFSMTKAITGAAAMQLVEQGRVGLDEPAARHLADLPTPEVLTGFDGDGRPTTRPAVGDITLRNLLTHTSGFVYELWNPDLARWQQVTDTPPLFSLRIAALQTPLAFDPGERWEYGTGIDWAGLIVERVTGQTLGEYFAEHLTGPLGMHDTAFTPTESMLERAASVHARLPDGTFSPIELPPAESPEYEMGGGGLMSTMGDYGRFLRMILNDGELDGVRVLQPATVATMAANHIGDLRVQPLRTVSPRMSNDAELFPDVPKSWGLTFQIHEADGATGCRAGTLSWAGLANSYFWVDRRSGIAGCYLSQILPFADEGSINLFYDVQRTVYANCGT